MADPKSDQVDADITQVKDLGDGRVDVWLEYVWLHDDDGTTESWSCQVRFDFRTACAMLVVEDDAEALAYNEGEWRDRSILIARTLGDVGHAVGSVFRYNTLKRFSFN